MFTCSLRLWHLGSIVWELVRPDWSSDSQVAEHPSLQVHLGCHAWSLRWHNVCWCHSSSRANSKKKKITYFQRNNLLTLIHNSKNLRERIYCGKLLVKWTSLVFTQRYKRIEINDWEALHWHQSYQKCVRTTFGAI